MSRGAKEVVYRQGIELLRPVAVAILEEANTLFLNGTGDVQVIGPEEEGTGDLVTRVDPAVANPDRDDPRMNSSLPQMFSPGGSWPHRTSIYASGAGQAFTFLVSALDAGNHTEVRLLDARTLRPRAKVAMPLGQGNVSEFSEDGRRFLARWSTACPATGFAFPSYNIARTGLAVALANVLTLPIVEAKLVFV